MIKETKLLILFAIFIVFISSSAVFAHENITCDELSIDDSITVESAVKNNVDISEDAQQNLQSDSQVESEILTDSPGNFTELSKLISSSSGSVNLTKDYVYSEGDNSISISKKVTINGNGHTIDAKKSSSIFSIYTSGVVLNNISFVNGKSGSGAAVYVSSSDTLIENCNFENNSVYYSGGAIYASSSCRNLEIRNCNFYNNSFAAEKYYRNEGGGAIGTRAGYNLTITDCNFTSNSGTGFGGAIMLWYMDTVIENCIFKNNTAKEGAAIQWDARGGYINNSRFINNTAIYDGGAIECGVYANSPYFENLYFESNTAYDRGGGLFVNAINGKFNNLTFVGNYATTGGGAYMGYGTSDSSNSGNLIYNSRFINNTARYGGAGADIIANSTIRDCEFIGNVAPNYGGAVSMANSNLDYNVFVNNSASFGGAVYTYNSTIANSSFYNNNAPKGSAIFILNRSSLVNNDVSDDEVYYRTSAEAGGRIVDHNYDIESIMMTDRGYFAFCSEIHNEKPYTGEYDHSMELLKNALNGHPIADYLKILIYQYVDHMNDLNNTDFRQYIWDFTDRSYWTSDDPVIQEVIRLYDSGFRVPTINACKVLVNGTLMYFNFSSLITPSGQQNLFLFKYDHGDEINETLTKEALNKTALVNDTIEYRIVVSNKGTSPIYYLWVEDKDYSAGLKYETWHPESGNWTYNNETQHWILDELPPAKSASLILIFRVMINGTLYNNATSGVGTLNVTNSSDDVRVYSVNLTVEKNTLTKRVKVGEITEFEIIVRNIGEVDLKNVFVRENKYDSGLVYLNYTSIKGNWRYDLDDDAKPRFTLTDLLKVGESASFRVIFNTTQIGNFSNTVEAGYNNTTVSNSTNVTEVFNETKKDNYTKNETDDNITSKIPGNSTDVHVKKHVPTENITEEIIQKNNASEDKIKSDNRVIDDKATGNPLILLLLALIMVSFRRFKN